MTKHISELPDGHYKAEVVNRRLIIKNRKVYIETTYTVKEKGYHGGFTHYSRPFPIEGGKA